MTTALLILLHVLAVFKHQPKKPEYAQRKEKDFKPHQRDSIIKMLSQAYWQMCSPIFQEWRQYAWYSGGYVDSCAPKCDRPIQYCFDRKVYGKCQLSGCKGLSMIKCAYCAKNICFQQFVIECHRCV